MNICSGSGRKPDETAASQTDTQLRGVRMTTSASGAQRNAGIGPPANHPDPGHFGRS
jgi:hypothetical protein